MRQFIRITILAITGIVFLLSTGCISSHPGSSSLAHVVVENASVETIRSATTQTFQQEFYTVLESSADRIVFERDATQKDRILWARYGEQGVRMRVVVTFEAFAGNGILVRADAYILRERGAGRQEKITPAGRRPYQKILQDIEHTVVTGRIQ